jgi:hypothetical protein
MNNHPKRAFEAGAQQAIKEAREGWETVDPGEDASDLFRRAGGTSKGRSFLVDQSKQKDPDQTIYGKPPKTLLARPINYGLDLVPTDSSVYDDTTGELKDGLASTVLSSLWNPGARKDRRDSRDRARRSAKYWLNNPQATPAPIKLPVPDPEKTPAITKASPKVTTKKEGSHVNNHLKLAYEEGQALARSAAQADYLDDVLRRPGQGLLGPATRDLRAALKHRDLMAVGREALPARAVRAVLAPAAALGTGVLGGAALGATAGLPGTGALAGLAGAAPLALTGEGRRLMVAPKGLRRMDALRHLAVSPTGRLAGRAALIAALGGAGYALLKD